MMLCCIPCTVLCCPSKAHQTQDEFEGVEPHDDNGNGDQEKLIGDKDEPGIKEFEEMLNGERQAGGGGHGEAFGDVMVWQMVETIEFVLGTISCTASYLRLWALSLSHGQLSEVFIKMFFLQLPTMISGGDEDAAHLASWSTGLLIPYLFVMAFGFMMATFFVLFGMDVMEVALHCLRLHWVEFMKQFFEGKGYKYTPFSFNAIFEAEMTRSD